MDYIFGAVDRESIHPGVWYNVLTHYHYPNKKQLIK